jgi:hypothetical protein
VRRSSRGGQPRISTAIKYLTQSTWSHAVLYLGNRLARDASDPEPPVLLEADLLHGMRIVPLSFYDRCHTRICRPVGLSEADCEAIIDAGLARVGHQYNLKNVIDLARLSAADPAGTRALAAAHDRAGQRRADTRYLLYTHCPTLPLCRRVRLSSRPAR